MKIESPQKNRIVIELTRDDMFDLDITYEQMDYSNIETRRVIWTLLDMARRQLGRDIDPSSKMLIEAMPDTGGGCRIYFTVPDKNENIRERKNVINIKKERDAVIYEFDSLEKLISCAEALTSSGNDVPKGDLYYLGGRYRLMLYLCGKPRSLGRFFSEYGTVCSESKLFAEFTREHWKLLSENNAVETVGKL